MISKNPLHATLATFILSIASAREAVSAERAITAPYQPSFWAQYVPRITAARKRHYLVDTILTNPGAALAWAHSVRNRYGTEAKAVKTASPRDKNYSPAHTKGLLRKYTAECPTFLLGECVQEDFGHCLLSRRFDPNFRQQFESHAVASLRQHTQTLDRPVQYVSFGCGGIFQDHVIITKTLAQQPNARIDLHLIDTKHRPYVACRDLLEDTRVVSSHCFTDPMPIMEEFRKRARASGAPEDLNDEQLTDSLIETCMGLEAPAQQSVSWLSHTFPHAQLRLHLHDTVDSYYQYAKQQDLWAPDVITAADIEDEMSQLQQSRLHYAKLCVRALQDNPHAQNLWLRKDVYKNTASLVRLALADTPGATKEDVPLQAGKTTPIYLAQQNLLGSISLMTRLRIKYATAKNWITRTVRTALRRS